MATLPKACPIGTPAEVGKHTPDPLLQSWHVQVLRSGRAASTRQKHLDDGVRRTGVSVGVQAARVVFPEPDRAEIATAITDNPGDGRAHLGPHTRAIRGAPSPPPTKARRGPRTAFRPGCRARRGRRGRQRDRRAGDPAAQRRRRRPRRRRPREHLLRHRRGRDQRGRRGRSSPTSTRTTFALSPQTLAAALTPEHGGRRARAHRRADHAAGRRAARICAERGIALVEDAAHAHGSTFDGRFAGSFGAAAAFSFYPTKVVTSGEGGMILTGPADLADEATDLP